MRTGVDPQSGTTGNQAVPLPATVLSAALAGVGVVLLMVALARHKRSPRTMHSLRVLGALALLAGAAGVLVAAVPKHGAARAPGARVVRLFVSDRGIRYETEGALSGQVLHVQADERVALDFELEGRCRVTLPDLGIDAFLTSGDSIWFRSNGTVPSELHVSGVGCPTDATLGIVPLERLDYFHWVDTTAQFPWTKAGHPPYEDPVEVGRRLAQERCSTCHSVDGSDRDGPTFAGLCGSTVPIGGGRTRTADTTYLHAKIELGRALFADPRWVEEPVTPEEQVYDGWHRYGESLDEEQVGNLVAYIQSLSDACIPDLPRRAPSTKRDRIRFRAREQIFTACRFCHDLNIGGERAPQFAGLYGSTVELTDGTTRVVDEAFIEQVLLRGPDAPHDVRFEKASGHDYRFAYTKERLDMLIEGLKEFAPGDAR